MRRFLLVLLCVALGATSTQSEPGGSGWLRSTSVDERRLWAAPRVTMAEQFHAAPQLQRWLRTLTSPNPACTQRGTGDYRCCLGSCLPSAQRPRLVQISGHHKSGSLVGARLASELSALFRTTIVSNSMHVCATYERSATWKTLTLTLTRPDPLFRPCIFACLPLLVFWIFPILLCQPCQGGARFCPRDVVSRVIMARRPAALFTR